ncbi:MAG: RDD family protein [Bdellovibrionales bacterium]|nr:RDD family protein [Bdellovibrionales bacterium]
MSNSNMDPFDEFEFKPLTDGLGFHKKAVSLKEGLKSSGVLEDELQTVPASIPKSLLEDKPKASAKKHSFEDVLSALEKTPLNRPADLEFTETLPREAKKTPVQSPFPRNEAYKAPLPGTPAVPEVKKVPKQVEQAAVGTRRGAADSPVTRRLESATISVPSAFLDFVIVLALSLVFLVALLMVTKVDINVVLRNLSRDQMTQIALGIMFLAVMQMYVVIARSFFGATLGEWTFDLQVGEEKQQKAESYPLRVAFRSLLTTITGLIFLPLVSALLRRDIAGSLSGVKLYRHNP